jgi:hypothetical protein
MNNWIPCAEQLPKENTVVETRIDDECGIRNQQKLQRIKNLWWVEDGSLYVYYPPNTLETIVRLVVE